jgi:methionyl-tRNA synthetase
MRELSKLTPQGHVHAQELYSALNLVRRCPPAPMLSALVTNPGFIQPDFRRNETLGFLRKPLQDLCISRP